MFIILYAVGDDDFASSFEAAVGRLQVAILEACESADDWPRKVAAAVRAGLSLAARDEAGAQALTNEALAHGPDGVARYERLVANLREGLAPGREERPDGAHLPDFIEQALASGVLMLVAQRIDAGRAAELPALAPEAIQFVLTPYLGPEEARRVAVETPSPRLGLS
jgi:hypothetical protein